MSKNYDKSVKGGARSGNLLDSGTSAFISRHPEDFDSMETKPSVSVVSAGGEKTVAFKGKMKPNSCYLERGVYMPSLAVDRLIPSNELNDLGWCITLDKPKSFATHPDSGESIDIHNPCEGKLPQILISFEEQALAAGIRDAGASRALMHRRFGHLGCFRSNRPCEACLRAKGLKKSHRKIRPDIYKPRFPLQQLDLDFCGPFPVESVNGAQYALAAICPLTGYVAIRPIRHKSEVTEKLSKIIVSYRKRFGAFLGDKVVFAVRSDNEPTFGSKYEASLDELEVKVDHSVPYHPQTNGVIERFFRTMQSCLRAMLVGVDHRLWDYALLYFQDIWNNVGRDPSPRSLVENFHENRKNRVQSIGPAGIKHEEEKRPGGSGLEICPGGSGLEKNIGKGGLEFCPDETGQELERPEEFVGLSSEASAVNPVEEVQRPVPAGAGLPPFRIFGCRVFAKLHTIGNKLVPDGVEGVFLGFDPESSNSLIGAWMSGTFTEIRTLDIKYLEEDLVSDIRKLDRGPSPGVEKEKQDNGKEENEKAGPAPGNRY